jgi:CDP-2,3-bis-(O-geranylgeranyl)-sn-glycerol synthase
MNPIIIIQAIWLFLPAGVANMAPILFRKIPLLNYPIDFKLRFRNKPLFGKNKTWRGLIVGIITATIFTLIQTLLYKFIPSWYLFEYTYTNFYIIGILLGAGALVGDFVESFFKRQLNIKPGKSWPVFDQLDWIFGAIIFLLFYQPLNTWIIIAAIIIYGLLHPLTNIIGYLLKFKKNII